MITYTKFLALCEDILDYNVQKDAVIADNTLHITGAERAVKAGSILWAAGTGDIQELIRESEMSAYALANKYGIEDRTVHYWASGNRKAPKYVTRLLGYAMLQELAEKTKRIYYVQDAYPSNENLEFFAGEKEALEHARYRWDHFTETEKNQYRKNQYGEYRLQVGVIEVPDTMEEDEYWDAVLDQDYGEEILNLVD